MRGTHGAQNRLRAIIFALAAGSLSLTALAATAVATAAQVVLAHPSAPDVAQAGFDPLSVTFVSLRTGWVLGTVPCRTPGGCIALQETTDAGTTWSARPLPAALVALADSKKNAGALSDGPSGSWLNVRFADQLDGWIYGGFPNGGPVVWSTHDGGTAWRQQPLAGFEHYDPIFDLEASRGTVYLMGIGKGLGVTVESSPVGEDTWRVDRTPALPLPAGGAQAGGSIVFQGGKGWLVEGNDRGVTGSAELSGAGRWRDWRAPCASVGDSFTVPAAASTSNLVAVCVMGGFASSLSKSAPPGATLGSSWLYFSGNGGESFQAGPELSPRGGDYSGVLASPSPGVVFIGRYGTSGQLVGSFDGGYHWDVVYGGSLFYLGFTSPSQGVGLVRLSRGNGPGTAMIMSFDGGHHWARVKF